MPRHVPFARTRHRVVIGRDDVNRGGPFGCDTQVALARAECAGAAPGTEFRFSSPDAESSPIRARRDRADLSRRSFMFGAALLGFAVAAWYGSAAGYVHAKAWVGQQLLRDAWEASGLSGGGPVKPWPWADTHPIARLTVPAHGVDLLVLAGASGRTLAWGPGHVDGTSAPGARGTAVLTAHRDTHFAFLRALQPGDRIVVQTPSGPAREFHVDRTLVADHRVLRIPADDSARTLALVTCYPFDALDPGTPLRYAVIARAE